ncbi:MAG: hypothetical protein JWN14_179, partial [Chthonomonadales bacterium]|nr:hypothetical protein [Chthonomonadales bacterium]
MIKYRGVCWKRGWTGPNRRTSGMILLLVGLAATQGRAQGSATRSVDSLGMSPAEIDAAGKNVSKTQENLTKKPTAVKKPEEAKQGDSKPSDRHPPALIPSVPSVTDTAAISDPGWIEADL